MLNKEIGELEKIQDSGAAQVILRDLKKKRSVSPTLDPRNASRVPSAETACQHKLRYETPYFACEFVIACLMLEHCWKMTSAI